MADTEVVEQTLSESEAAEAALAAEVEEMYKAFDTETDPGGETETVVVDAEPPAQQEEESNAIPPEMRRAAYLSGMTDAEIDAIGTPGGMAVVLRRVNEVARMAQRPAAPVAKEEPKAEKPSLKYQSKLNPEEVEESLIEDLKGRDEHTARVLEAMQTKMAALEQKLAEAGQVVQQESASRMAAELTKAVGSWPEPMRQALGGGDLSTIAPGTKEYDAALKVTRAANRLGKDWDEAIDGDRPSAAELFTRAAYSVLGREIIGTVTKTADKAAAVAKKQTSFVRPPGGAPKAIDRKNETPEQAEKRLQAEVSAMLREFGEDE